MSEPTRPLHQPRVESDGSLVAHSVATPTSFKVRARVTVGSRKVIPVIFVPGIMGSNLRFRRNLEPQTGSTVKPGEAAWRPPNGLIDGYRAMTLWSERDPAQRQRILNAGLLEVDPEGDLDYHGSLLDEHVMRERGWGEVHAASYGTVLVELQRRLDKTYERSTTTGKREVRSYWKRVMQVSPDRWGVRSIDKITEAELEKYAAYQYPVYAFGYNWLESCEVSGQRLRKRIEQIKKFWSERKHDCRKVILVTHSMGGLVARACARMHESTDGEDPDIAGVIHGVMPALGAPVAYRRIACGTEGGNFTNQLMDNINAAAFAEIAGETAAETTPVMALAPGVLQLLPNHLYPRPWLHIKTIRTVNQKDEVHDLLALPDENPYDFYRDMTSWFRMIDPGLVDPAKLYTKSPGGIVRLVRERIDQAERFHTRFLAVERDAAKPGTPYYHPNTYAFYGADAGLKTYARIRWVARLPASTRGVITPANVRKAKLLAASREGMREVAIETDLRLRFAVWPQDSHGDETVPVESGAGPKPHVRQVFSAAGFRHQESYSHSDMLLLTRHLIVKIVQGMQ